MKLQYHLQGNFSFGGFAPEPASGNVVPRTPYTPSRGGVYILPGLNSSWGIHTAENKDLWIRKIIRLHNQQ